MEKIQEKKTTLFRRKPTITYKESGQLLTVQTGYRTVEEQVQPMIKAGWRLDEYRSKVNDKSIFVPYGNKDGYYVSKTDIADYMKRKNDLDEAFKESQRKRKEEDAKDYAALKAAQKNIVVNNSQVVDNAGNN